MIYATQNSLSHYSAIITTQTVCEIPLSFILSSFVSRAHNIVVMQIALFPVFSTCFVLHYSGINHRATVHYVETLMSNRSSDAANSESCFVHDDVNRPNIHIYVSEIARRVSPKNRPQSFKHNLHL